MEATLSPSSEVSTPTPTAAPATSAPSVSMTPEQRPTFAEAFARDAAPTPAPATPEGDPSATATEAAPTDASAQGPIPFTVHKTALENARTKATEQARAEFQQEYGWAQNLDRQSVESAMSIGQMYQQDRPGFIRQVLAEAMSDADLAPLIRSEAARALSSGRGQQQAAPQAPDLSPDIPVMDSEGRMVAQTFSAEKVQQIVQHAIQQAMDREVGPMKADYQSRQQQEQAHQARQALETATTDIYQEAVDVLPAFKEHEAEIAKVFATIPGEPARALRAAWKQVVGGKLADAGRVKADYVTELQTKAAASGVNPAAAAIAPSKRIRSFNDPSLKWS